MPLMNTVPMEFYEEPTFKPDILKQTPFIHGTKFTAIRQMENLRNRYYAVSTDLGTIIPSQAHMIARTNPPVKVAVSITNLDRSGFGRTYALSDELLRQYSLGTYLQNAKNTFYQTRP